MPGDHLESELGRVFENPLRARIYDLISRGEASSSEIARTLGLPVPNVSYHVRTLASAGLIEQTRTTRKRGAVETHYRATRRIRRSRPHEHWTSARRRAEISPIVEAIVEGIDAEDILEEQRTVLFFESDDVDEACVPLAARQLIDWSSRLRELESASWARDPRGVRWYAAPAWLGLGHPPPGASRRALVHPRGDELPLRPALSLPHTRAIDPPEHRQPSVVALADAAELDLLLHPLRMRILRLLHSPGSAKELAEALGESVASTSYHMRTLRDAGLLEVMGEARRRGAIETYYRSSYVLEILEPEWRALTPAQRKRFLRTAQRESIQSLRHVTVQGGFDDPQRSVLLRLVVRLDDEAASVAAEELMQLHVDLAYMGENSANPTAAITVGAALLVQDPTPGQQMELRRHLDTETAALLGVVRDADPTSVANPLSPIVAG